MSPYFSHIARHSCQTLSRQREIPWQFAALGMLSVTNIMPVLVQNTCMDANIQFTINSFRQLFHDKIFSLAFPWFLVKSTTAVKFRDISRQVITLCKLFNMDNRNK